MKRLYLFLVTCVVTWIGLCSQNLKEGFLNPPSEARPSTYWEWMNGNITKEGITKDLEYMKNAYYGAAIIFDAGVGIPKGNINYNSKDWKEMVSHAMKEAQRLGLKLSIHNAPGYSGTGGPWIPVEHSMKQLVWSETLVELKKGGLVEIDLPKPHSKMDFYRDAYVLAYPSFKEETVTFSQIVNSMILDGEDIEINKLLDHDLSSGIRLEKGQSLLVKLNSSFVAQAATVFRGGREKPLDPHDGPRDYAPKLKMEVSEDGVNYVAVGHFNCPPLRAMDAPGTLSFPIRKIQWIRLTTDRGTNLAELDVHTSPRLQDYASKVNYVNAKVGLKNNPQNVGMEYIIDSKSIVDLTECLDETGHLKWKAPKGRWTLVRIGYTTTGEVVAAAGDSGIGLDCDKFSKDALDIHIDSLLVPLMDYLKPWVGNTLEGYVIDSWEAGKQNWSEDLPDYFKRSRGYDIMPYMLAATGRIVDSVDDTERFLWDFRRTHADMFLENYVEYFKERMSKYGLKYAGEAYGDGNFESLEFAARQDVPMCEFWTHYIYGSITTTMLAASSAHVWNKSIVACECYTGTPFNSKFTEHPYGMKALGDYIMTAGVNRFVYHATTHQPYSGDQPGNIMTMGPFGTHLDRNSTWINQFGSFNLYNSRCAYLLQQGRYVADVLYLKDEAMSSGVENYNVVSPATPYGYRWDVAGCEVLEHDIVINNGRIILPGGMEYTIMVLPDMYRTTPQTLERILDLVKKGMTVLLTGDMPVGYIGLDKEKDKQVQRLACELWNSSSDEKYNVYHKKSLSEILDIKGIVADFSFLSENKDAQIHFIHRKIGNDEVYFIANHRRRPEKLTIFLRGAEKVPELWDAETGKTGIQIPFDRVNGKIRLNLNLKESGSVFVVLRDRACKTTEIQEVTPKSTFVITKNGINEYHAGYDFKSTFTVSFWVKPETYATNGRGFVMFPRKGLDNMAYVGVSVGQNGVRIHERSQVNRMVLESVKPIEGWTHLALVYNRGIPSLYMNGRLENTGTHSGLTVLPSLDVPMDEEQFASGFEGDITSMAIYNYALSEDSLMRIVNQGLPEPAVNGTVLMDLSEGWKVSFPVESKITGCIELDYLHSLHRHGDFDVRHFSGTATYVKTLDLRKKDLKKLKGKRILLNLGRVENMAEVEINGKRVADLWKAPYEVDISDLLQFGMNEIVVKVTNLYPNRIIGDEYLPEMYEFDEYGRIKKLPDWFVKGEYNERERVLFLPWKFYKKDDPLLESGLLGPVRLTVD